MEQPNEQCCTVRPTQNNKMFFEAKHLEMTNCLSFHQIILEFTDMASTQMPKNWTKISRYDKLNYFVLCGYGPGPICSNGGSYFHDQVVNSAFL